MRVPWILHNSPTWTSIDCCWHGRGVLVYVSDQLGLGCESQYSNVRCDVRWSAELFRTITQFAGCPAARINSPLLLCLAR